MFGGLFDWLARRASRRRTAGLFIGCFVCVVLFQIRARAIHCHPECAEGVCNPAVCAPPDSRALGYDANDLKLFFKAIGDDGRHLYAWTQLTLDVAFPIFYAGFLAMMAVHLCPRWFGQWVVWLVVLGAVADLGENALVVWMAYDQPVEERAKAASILTSTKWGVLLVAILGIAAGGFTRPEDRPTGTA